jgi:hypothetical protein
MQKTVDTKHEKTRKKCLRGLATIMAQGLLSKRSEVQILFPQPIKAAIERLWLLLWDIWTTASTAMSSFLPN